MPQLRGQKFLLANIKSVAIVSFTFKAGKRSKTEEYYPRGMRCLYVNTSYFKTNFIFKPYLNKHLEYKTKQTNKKVMYS